MRKPALHGLHVAAGAKLTCEAGWEMPLAFASALEEVSAVRSRAGVFDLSHMGRIRIRGDGALELLERTCTADVAHQEDDTSLPTLLCNERGGIIDYARLIRLSSFWVLLTSPLCRPKVLEHLQSLGEPLGAKVDDQTPKTTMLGVSGPEAPKLLDAVLPFKASVLGAGQVLFGTLMVARYIAERADFTGLWGVRVSIPNMLAGQAWRFITEKAGDNRLPPAGLGAAEVLRIEAGLPRYGHELNETIDPFTADLGEAMSFDHDFLGREALEKIRNAPPARRPAGLILKTSEAPAIPRQGAAVLDADGNEVGTVTSGTFSPTLQSVIAMCYISPAVNVETTLTVDGCPAALTALPFVKA